MFHWICPECGREIAPTARECPACDPSAAAAVPAAAATEPEPAKPVLLLSAPAEPAPAPLQGRISAAPCPPVPVRPLPVAARGAILTPLAPKALPAQLSWRQVWPQPEPPRAPRIACAALRERPDTPSASPSAGIGAVAAGPELSPPPATSLPDLSALGSGGPALAGRADYASIAESRMVPAGNIINPKASFVQAQLSLPGPTLPHELTSLEAAGIARVLAGPGAYQAPQRSSWLLSFAVAAAVLAGTLAASFYAMPSLASPTAAPNAAKAELPAQPPAPPPASPDPLARRLEVTGVRFVTDLPDRPPQIQYLVVNHSNASLTALTVNVTLRVAATGVALSRFSFRSPRLGPYESKEMVSSIEHYSKGVSLPDWTGLRTEIEIR